MIYIDFFGNHSHGEQDGWMVDVCWEELMLGERNNVAMVNKADGVHICEIGCLCINMFFEDYEFSARSCTIKVFHGMIHGLKTC